MTATRLFFLGPPRIERDSQPIALTSAKAVALLAFLALNRAPQPRDKLLALLWAESAEDAARKNLRNTLWAIRKAIGEAGVQTDNNRIALDPDMWVDIRHFERVVNAPLDVAVDPMLDLYGGPFLDGLSLTEAPEFELWMAHERERLAGLYTALLSRLVEKRRASQDWQSILILARRALAHDPVQEPMYRALMESHAQLGDRSEALRQYDLLRTTLSRELGVEPLPETQALHTAILGGGLQPPVPVSGPRTDRRLPILGDSPRAPYVGRQAELGALDEELRASNERRVRIALITGDMGIGKTRLWQEWSARLPVETLALETRCLESTQALPFAPLNDLFSSRVCAQRLFSQETPLARIWLAELARLFPELRTRFPDLPTPPTLPPEEERRRILEAFTQSVIALRAEPLVLFIDDLHWVDRATLDWLDYLIHRLSDQPMLIVGAYRPNDATTSLAHVIANWTRAGLCRRVALGALSPDETRTLLTAFERDASQIDYIHTQSAGNPYFALELLRAAPGDVPATLHDLLTTRLDRLPEASRQVLQAAAVLEPDFSFPTLMRVSGRSEDETLDALDGLLAGELLTERSGQYAFVHPLVAGIVRGTLSNARSTVLHRRAAQAREAEFVHRLPLVAAQLMLHYEHAGQPDRAAAFADMAADRALSLVATAEAERFARHAVDLQPTPARYVALGRMQYTAGDLRLARDTFRQGLDLARQRRDHTAELDALLSMAETFIPASQIDQLEFWVTQAMPLMASANPEMQARTHFLRANALIVAPNAFAQAEHELREAIRISHEFQLVAMEARATFELGNLLAERGDLTRAVDTFCESVALAQQAGQPFQEALGYNNAAYHALLKGDLTAAQAFVSAGLNIAESGGLRIPLQYLYSTRGEIALAEAEWVEAEMWFHRGLPHAQQAGNVRQIANYRANLGLAARGRGDLDAALVLLDDARALAITVAVPHLQIQIDLWLTELHAERGEYAAALEALKSAEARLTDNSRQTLVGWAARLRHSLKRG